MSYKINGEAGNTAINNGTLTIENNNYNGDITVTIIAAKDGQTAEETITIPFCPQQTVSLSGPEKTVYNNSDDVTLTAGSGQSIRYTVDYIHANGTGTISDVLTGGADFPAGGFTLPFISHPNGGTLVVQAVAMDGENQASEIWRQDYTFAASQEDAFTVGATIYDSFAEAVAAVNDMNETAGTTPTIYLNNNVELASDAEMPNKPCIIASANGKRCTFKASQLTLNSAVTFDNLYYDVQQLITGDNQVTINDTVDAVISVLGHQIFGSKVTILNEQDYSATKEENNLYEILPENTSGWFDWIWEVLT